MVDEGYDRFLRVVTAGRPKLKRHVLLERFTVKPLIPDPQAKRTVPVKPYTRYRADGGIFSAAKAKELGLIDAIGDLDRAVAAAARLADLDDYKAITYRRPVGLMDLLLDLRSPTNPPQSAAPSLRRALTPRLWYLAPGHEAEALLAPAREEP